MQQGKANVIMNNFGNGFPATGGKTQGVAIPMASQTRKNHSVRHTSSSDFFSSTDSESSCSCSSSPGSPRPERGYTQLSASYQGGFSSGFQSMSKNQAPLNVYGTSPRTSVMFNYYNSPKPLPFGRPQLIRTKSTDSASPVPVSRNTIDFSDPKWEKATLPFEKPTLQPQKKPKVPVIVKSNQQPQLIDDSRPRAWSESDKAKSGNNVALHNSRMSALRKLKMKLGQKGPMKKQKSKDEDDQNRSGGSMSSLEKVEEGRQLEVASQKQSLLNERSSSPKSGSASVHQEHETRRRGERRAGVMKHPNPMQGHLPQVTESPEHDLIYQRFLEEHTCYDLMPTSSKLVVLDTRLEVKKAFHALVENSLRSAPLWDNESKEYVGVLTVSDFISILLAYHGCPNKKLEDLENQKISCWREIVKTKKTLIHISPNASIFEALGKLTEESIRRLAIINPLDGDILHVINHRRILHFLHLFMKELPKPQYMSKTLRELGVGTKSEVCVIHESSPVVDALKLIAEHKISGLPVIDNIGRVTDVFTKTDVLVLAGEQLFYDLSIKVKDVISLHSTVDLNDVTPTVIRTMPGSPALVRRKNQPRNPGNQLQSSTPVNVGNHPFIRNSNSSGAKNPPSPLVSHPSGASPKDKQYRQTNVKGSNAARPPIVEKAHNMSKGDSPNMMSPPSNPPFLHRRRHLTSNTPRSGSISTHLVTVSMEDTFESIIDNMVMADVPQAVIVDDFDHVKGVVSVGDILRFLIYPTTEDGEVIRNEDGSIQLSRSFDETSHWPKKGDLQHKRGRFQRTRTISDDTDMQSGRSPFSPEKPKLLSNPQMSHLSGSSLNDSGYSNSYHSPDKKSNPMIVPLLSVDQEGDDLSSEFNKLSLKNAGSSPKGNKNLVLNNPHPQNLASGEQIKRN